MPPVLEDVIDFYLDRLYAFDFARAKIDADRAMAAADRAAILLRALLTPAQRAMYDRSRCFDVIGSIRRDPGGYQRTYRIYHGRTGNVHAYVRDVLWPWRYCAHPIHVPDEDVMIAQKLLIETDEAAFLHVANRLT